MFAALALPFLHSFTFIPSMATTTLVLFIRVPPNTPNLLKLKSKSQSIVQGRRLLHENPTTKLLPQPINKHPSKQILAESMLGPALENPLQP
ncbi:hypothetical protein Fmac_021488 [Flemingia macrophylla]|uniref:Uncharacterized protein n=1 Tax=Flemingia macrophylla TaxID=520843 RepID=A0ABD1LX15_9FABA